MPRTPLQDITGNSLRRIELDSAPRHRIAGAHECGVSKHVISRVFGIARSTVRNIIAKDPIRYNQESLPRPGAPTSVTIQIERRILRFVRAHPKASLEGGGGRCRNHERRRSLPIVGPTPFDLGKHRVIR